MMCYDCMFLSCHKASVEELIEHFNIKKMKHNIEIKEKIKYIALQVFDGMYDEETITKWLKFFIKRFFNQQFKRSCLTDGPKVGTIGVSPRGDLRLPSDADSSNWLDI